MIIPATGVRGRRDERSAGVALIDRARSGNGGALVVEGVAGIGKTTLLGALAADAESAGMQVLEARAARLERTFPFGVVQQLFSGLLESRRARPDLFEGAARHAMVALRPWEQSRADGPRDIFPVLHGLHWLTANLAAERPLMLAVDDLQWADEPSLRWLNYLANRVERLPAGVIVTSRPPERESTPLLGPHAERLSLRPLDVATAGRLIADVMHAEPDPSFVAACHAATGGNPFLLHELARSMAARAIAPDADAAMAVLETTPETVVTSVRDRLAELDPGARDVARAVAVLGAGAPLAAAAEVAGLEPAAAAEAAGRLARAGLLCAGLPLTYVHALVEDAVRSQLSAAEGSVGHRRAADALRACGAGLDRVAAHLLEAEPSNDSEVERLLLEAADDAERRGAPESAVRYLERALRERAADPPSGELRLRLGAACLAAGADTAVEELEAALAAAEEGELHVRAARRLAFALGAVARAGDAAAVLEAACRRVPQEDRESRLVLEAERQAFLNLDGSGASGDGADLEELASELRGRTPGECLLLANLAVNRMNRGATVIAVGEAAHGALRDGTLVSSQTADGPGVYWAATALLGCGEFAAAIREMDAAVEDARRRGSVFAFTIASGMRAWSLLAAGRLIEAESDARAAIDAGEDTGWTTALPLAVGPLVSVLVEKGRLREARSVLAAHGLDRELPRQSVLVRVLTARAELAAAEHRPDFAVAELRGVQEWVRGDAGRWDPRAWRAQLAVALAASGNRSEATAIAAEEVAAAEARGSRFHLGTALRALGVALGGREGLQHLRRSIEVLQGTEALLDLAKSQVAAGAAQRRCNRRTDAVATLKNGLELADRCGADALAARALDELRAAGARPRRAALSGAAALTASERRVCELAAEGLTNRQIAQALFISTKTVEMHLYRGFRKLGIATRRELGPALLPGA